MRITPLILGRGRAGQAIAFALAQIALRRGELELAPPIWLTRESDLAAERAKHAHPLLCIAQPHGLHARAVALADRAGFPAVVCEKPAAVDGEQIAMLQGVKLKTAVLHVYRQMWGIQTIKAMVARGELGRLIAIEGRYWQSSAAEKALNVAQGAPAKPNWKNDVALSGAFDAYLDIASHWVDAASFLVGAPPEAIRGFRSFVNAEAPHRDTHVQLALRYPNDVRALTSVSKTVHGASNMFELTVIGQKGTVSWAFLAPDELRIGRGANLETVARRDSHMGSRLMPHHGMGWTEGYIEIIEQLMSDVFLGQKASYPSLGDTLPVLKSMLAADWT